MRKLILVLGFLGLLCMCVAQIEQNGQCDPNIQLVTDFDIDRFLGTWFEHRRGANPVQGGDCSYIEFSREGDDYTFYNKALNKNFAEELRGDLRNNGATLTLSLNNAADPTTLEVSILAVDSQYDVYALAYRCENISLTRRRIYIWQLGRATGPPTSTVDALVTTTLNNLFGISASELERVDNSELACYELPVIAPNQPIILPGQCDTNLRGISDFDVAAFTGTWHEIGSYYSPNAEGSCPRAQYTLEGSTVRVVNTEVKDQVLRTISGSATVISTDGSGKLGVTLEVLPGVNVEQELFILATDYENYAISYTCVNEDDNNKRVNSWILGRSRQLSEATQADVDSVIDQYLDLNKAYYQEAARTDADCFYYPEPQAGRVVTFRGTCDMNIRVQEEFDVARYLGTWYDLESYPSVFQNGSCNTANYALRPDTDPAIVDVLNTMVNDNTLDIMNGEARLATTDGTAKLLVTFPIAGTDLTVEMSYWVLDTDYDNYALVYTCTQIDEDTRNVWAWKLSRSKELTSTATENINRIIDSIDVLDQRYFEPKDHSVEGCFYIPEPRGEPVIFPGQCDLNVPVVDSFNFDQFQGIWHEIETYPKDDQPSTQCINHEWTLGIDNTFSLSSSAIFDQTLRITSSTVSSSDNSARLTIRLTNQNVEIPFWIIATDYENYALAYSCVNRNLYTKAVYSWKLSRSKSLTAADVTAIDSAMTSIDVLDNIYFETVGQTDEDCFYLPEIAAGEPIILPGQCDPDIQVVTQFRAGDYLGRWHMIQTYPSAFQDGECNDATYSLNADGSVNVFNTQVLNQQLDTITGRATVIPSIDGSAKLSVTFPSAPQPIEYWVLATDYTSYSLVYSCLNINTEQRQVWSWKLSRSKSLSEEATTAMDEVISRVNVLNSRYYQTVDNSPAACFYYPEPNGQPVVFRGQCDDDSISVVEQFDASKYMGQWYDIESYPSVFQGGSCNSAFYTLNTEPSVSVDVYNTQVVNQELDVIEGVAVPASNDGSAKLIVTFPIVGTNQTVSTNYWVLDTDYDSYSLVYTCVNLDFETRQVYSWKLSRTRELRPVAQANINSVINRVPVLDQTYFEPKDHTETGCFYFPEVQPGRPVVFPGTCNASIPVKENFDLGQFIGTWHEVESYPKDFAPGSCIRHQYSAGALNTLNLQTSAVSDGQALVVSQSTVTSPDVGDARLTITMNNGVTIPFWIIDTDYTDYALAYSCMNLNNTQTDYRGEAAVTNIATAMQSIDVIDQRYFEIVDQSDEGCFYFPQLADNEPVVFSGQCDDGITPMSNFDAERFSGRWFDIESYYDDDYQGQCVDGRFTLSGNSYDVAFSQVVNQELITTPSTAAIAADQSGRLTVTSTSGTVEFLVLATDYDNYALIYSCNNVDDSSRRVRSWKMSRTRELSQESRNQITLAIANINVLDERYYNARDHSQLACFYYPTPVRGQVVRFRGQCDNNIAVVQGFDVEKYLGTWYDIESYPNFFQDGTCGTAQYSLSETEPGVVDVYNTQVVNQQLDTINGTAVVASTDESAKLTVTFPVVDTDQFISTPYWVLATDYDNYALVYSCNQIDDEYYSIGSWKLSRQQSLSSESQIEINNKMNEVKELRQQYFEETGHTEDDCFFYPELNGGPVILPGKCPLPEEINAVTNFDHASFSGTWYEDSRFPSNFLEVECSSTELTVNGDNYDWQQRGVKDEELYVTRTEAVGQPGSGVYTVQFGEESIQQSFFVLDTDYTSFALLYSCLERGDNEKQIYSYKLKRTASELSTEAKARIAAIISSTRDLFEDYYVETVRNDDACFYYPRFETPPDVITMPGPCPNIAAVPDFNATAYLGTWYEIARYPQADQPGTCSRAQYSLGDNQVDVRNTDVIDQRLNVQIGSAVVKSADNSGILEVTFDVTLSNDTIVTVVADYYILATDYYNYALVYNCKESTQAGYVDVYSWKLSRQRSLSEEAENAIKDKIEEVRGLLENYYVPTSQDDEDCFYIPEFVENEAPMFRGTCQDLNLDDRGVFNTTAFLGWWHEIESYSIDDEPAECISSRYQQSDNGIQVVDTSVNGLESSVDTFTVEIREDWTIIRRAADGSETKQHVLATDYNTYALVYSCVDVAQTDELDDNYRRVWSAKLSREPEQEFSEVAITAIDTIISENVDLQPRLYRTVLQTDEACFHYPEPSLVRDRVVLRLQCDQNTDVQANFTLENFTGTWYQLERYPYPEVSSASTCIGTRYTIANETTKELSIVNWEVRDGNLSIIEGTANQATDGSARLEVTLPSLEEGGESSTTTLYILETDYVTYAVAMTCEKLNNYESAVVAFKLSREREIKEDDRAKIDTLVSERKELYQGYFLNVTQYEECEEPSSGNFIRSSIIVLLICAVWQLTM